MPANNDKPLAQRRKEDRKKPKPKKKGVPRKTMDPLNDVPLSQRRKQATGTTKKNNKRGQAAPDVAPPHASSALNALPLDIWRDIMGRANNVKNVNSLMQVVKSDELRKAAREGKAMWYALYPRLPIRMVGLAGQSTQYLGIHTDDPMAQHVICIGQPGKTSTLLVRTLSHDVTSWNVKTADVVDKRVSPSDMLRILMQVREEVIRKFKNENMYHNDDYVHLKFDRLYPETTPEASAKFCIVNGIDYEDKLFRGAYSRYTYLRKSKVLHVLDRAIEVCLYFSKKLYMGLTKETYADLLKRMNDPKTPFLSGVKLPDVYINYKGGRYLSHIDTASGERYIMIDGTPAFLQKIYGWHWCE